MTSCNVSHRLYLRADAWEFWVSVPIVWTPYLSSTVMVLFFTCFFPIVLLLHCHCLKTLSDLLPADVSGLMLPCHVTVVAFPRRTDSYLDRHLVPSFPSTTTIFKKQFYRNLWHALGIRQGGALVAQRDGSHSNRRPRSLGPSRPT